MKHVLPLSPGAAIAAQEVQKAPRQQPRRSWPQILQRRPKLKWGINTMNTFVNADTMRGRYEGHGDNG